MTWYWATLLTLLPTFWLVQLVLHEGSHLLVARFMGYKAEGMWPFPHWYRWRSKAWLLWPKTFRRPDDSWRFYFARCRYARRTTRLERDPVAIAPMWMGLGVFVVGLLLNWLVPVFGFFLPLVVCSFGEIPRFWWTYFWGSPSTDGKKWRYGGTGAP